MLLRGVDFPSVMNASGAQGFFGEGYSYHRYWKFMGLTFKGCGFVSKTATFDPRVGNMPLCKKDGITPKERFPDCIRPYIKGVALNAVGLSNPGIVALLKKGQWQQRREPFLISIMAVGETPYQRSGEIEAIVALIKKFWAQEFCCPFGIELNISCPNVGLDPSHLIEEAGDACDKVGFYLSCPLVVKINALVSPSIAKQICSHSACDGVTISNTIPWGQLPDKIQWKQLFGTDISPLKKYGGGGLSGWPLLPIVVDWIKEARSLDFEKPIIACGGIMNQDAVRQVVEAGANGIQLGTVCMLRPWRMRGMIQLGKQLLNTA